MSVSPNSLNAWRDLLMSGALTLRRYEALERLATHGPMTGSELDRALGNPSAHKRLVELQDLGVVEIVRDRECSVTGRICAEWRALDRMPSGVIKRTAKRSLKELQEENAQLRAELEKLQRKLKRQMSLFGEANQ